MTIAQTPEERRQRLPAGVLGPIVAIGALLALPLPSLGHGPTIVGLALYAVIAAVVILRLPAYHPFASFGAANLTTLARAALVAALAGLLLAPPALRDQPIVFLTAALAVMLDGVDGWLARRGGMASRFGARFDMEVDALLIMVLSALAWVDGKAGIWVLSIGLMRYAFVVAGSVLPALVEELPPSRRRKLVCVLQMAVLALLTLPGVTSPWSDALAFLCLLTLAWSFFVDTRWLLRTAASR